VSRIDQRDVVEHHAGIRHGETRRPQLLRQETDTEYGNQRKTERDSQHSPQH